MISGIDRKTFPTASGRFAAKVELEEVIRDRDRAKKKCFRASFADGGAVEIYCGASDDRTFERGCVVSPRKAERPHEALRSPSRQFVR